MEFETGNSKLETGQVIGAQYSGIDLAAEQFDHAQWGKSHPIQITRYWSGEEAPPGRHAEARIIWTSEALCVRFVCRQAEPIIASPNPETRKKTIGLWERDVCEIFIAPDPTVPERYFEFEAAPTGEWIDLAIHTTPEKRETDWNFNSGMTAAARIEQKRVTIAIRIPWDDWIHKPQKGERWRVNLFRVLGSSKDRGYLAWQPTFTKEPNFHVPGVFGWLCFA